MNNDVFCAVLALEAAQMAKKQNLLYRATPKTCRMIELGLKARGRCIWCGVIDELTGQTYLRMTTKVSAFAGRRANANVIFKENELRSVIVGLKWYIRITKQNGRTKL